MEIDFEVEGLKELERELRKLDAKMAGKQLKGALYTAVGPALRAYKGSVPVRTGKLKKSIKRKSLRSARLRTSKATRGAFSSPDKAAGVIIYSEKKTAWQAHIVERGTKTRKTKGRGGNRGAIQAGNHLQNAWDRHIVAGEKGLMRFRKSMRRRLANLGKKGIL
ncbi:MAG: hypothetical protein EBV86_01930 [Marivivens sp.]|nr:hypothetical protein [Marivivens sp.]NCW67315.1 hypothetical protein [Marivivens sp.]